MEYEIRRRAYLIWQRKEEMGIQSKPEQNWAEAEREVLDERYRYENYQKTEYSEL